jgi:membrane fusion protein, multidrug efflux system
MRKIPHLQATRLALLTGAALLAACSPPPAPAPVVPSVFVSPVRNDSGAMQRVLSGSVRPRVEAELSFRTGGKVTARLVELGQAVRAGQALARLDPADYQLAVQAADEQQRAAEVDAVQAASDAARFKRLLADGSVGAADAERQQARADAAAARLTQAQKQAELARNRAAYAVLAAPFDGVVTAVRFEVGQLVDDRQPVLSLARPGELEVVVDVPEPLVAGLKGWQASVLPGEVPGTAQGRPLPLPLPLRLRELAPSANPATRTTRARYALAAPGEGTAWRMGMTAEVRLQRSGVQAGAELPLGALLVTQAATAGPAVWLVDAGTGALKRQPVQLLSQTTDHVRVGGLADGALVVSVGAQKLDAGMKVQPVQRPLVAAQAGLHAPVAPR